MAIQSLGYIGVDSGQATAWRDFACNVMGLQDVSAALAGDSDTQYFKMDDHPYRFFVQAADRESLAVCGLGNKQPAGSRRGRRSA